jgi:hypothetical protein
MLNEPCGLVSGSQYQITAPSRRVVADGFVVKDGSTIVQPAAFDQLFGLVTLAAPAAGAVRVTGEYYPLQSVALCREFSLSVKPTMLDVTTFDSAGWKRHLSGLRDLSGSIMTLSTIMDEFPALFNGQEKSVIEFQPSALHLPLRAWVQFEMFDSKASVDGLVEATINFQGAGPCGMGI